MKDNSEKIEEIVLHELSKYKHDPNKVIDAPDVFLAIEDENGPISVFSSGNFSVLLGKPKSRKTTLLSIIGAAILREDRKIGILSSPCKSEKLLWIDTEQNEYHLSRNMHSLSKMMDDKLRNLITYRFRNVDPNDRFTHIKTLIQYYVKQGVRVVVIDGIADLLTKGYNDEEDAIKISNFLLKVTEDFDIHIITVLHENKGNALAKGHLGSYLIQKTESVINVTKNERDKQFSEVSSNFTRGKDFPSFFISYNEKDVPCIVDKGTPISTIKKTNTPADLDVQSHKNLLAEIFSSDKEKLLRNELIAGIRKELEGYGIHLSENRGIQWLKYYKDQGLIIQLLNQQNKPYCLPVE